MLKQHAINITAIRDKTDEIDELVSELIFCIREGKCSEYILPQLMEIQNKVVEAKVIIGRGKTE